MACPGLTEIVNHSLMVYIPNFQFFVHFSHTPLGAILLYGGISRYFPLRSFAFDSLLWSNEGRQEPDVPGQFLFLVFVSSDISW